MQLSLKDIINVEKGKKGIIIGMGPSLTDNIEQIQKISKDPNTIIISCNHCESIIPEVEVNYWVISNSLSSMKVETNISKWHKRPESVLVWASSVDKSKIKTVNSKLKNKHVPFDQRNFNTHGNTIQETLKSHTNGDELYGTGDTVAVHMMSLAILLGLTEVQVIGIDLDYSRGYARNDRGVSPCSYADSEVNKYRDRITNDIKIIYKSGQKVSTSFKVFGKGSDYLNETIGKFVNES